MDILKGIGVSSGVSIAPAFVVKRSDPPITKRQIKDSEIETEKDKFRRALDITRDQLERTQNIISKNMGKEHGELVDAQIMLLSDKSIVNRTLERIEDDKICASWVFTKVIDVFLDQAKSMNDPFFRERVQEFQDIKRRVISNILGFRHEFVIKQNESRILVIDHLSPSETAQLFESNYSGIVCEVGGETSHIAIMARTMEIPAVLGVEKATSLIKANSPVVIDGDEGRVFVNPDSHTIEEKAEKIEHIEEAKAVFFAELDLPAVTTDGHEIKIASNIELPDEVKLMLKYNSQGIGLFRTELLYMAGKEFPLEDLQTMIYTKVIRQCRGEQVIIRTFDIGGDKFSDSFEHHLEPNPFLGWRAIRIGIDYPHLLKTQIRAILRSAAAGPCSIMFPMVSSIGDIVFARNLVDEAITELRHENAVFDPDVPVGIMIEVPAAAIIAERMAPYVDFMSIGTNDLIQYTMAADRGNEKVAKWYQTYHPAHLELIKRTIDAGHLHGIWVGMCGGMAGKLLAIPFLIGLGIDELSVNPSQIPLVKAIVRRISFADALVIAEKSMLLPTHEQVEDYLRHEAERLLPETALNFI